MRLVGEDIVHFVPSGEQGTGGCEALSRRLFAMASASE